MATTLAPTCPRCGGPRPDGVEHDARRCFATVARASQIADDHIGDISTWLRDNPVGSCSWEMRRMRQDKLKMLASWLKQAGYIAEADLDINT